MLILVLIIGTISDTTTIRSQPEVHTREFHPATISPRDRTSS
jgi:hypothetical protein